MSRLVRVTRGLLLGTVIVSLLVACADMPSDPREGGFFGGVAGLSSGAYESRVRDREDRLADLRATQSLLETERDTLEGRKQAASQALAAERARASQLKADVSKLDREVASLTQRQGMDKKRLLELQTRMGALKKQSAHQMSALDALEGSGVGGTEADLKRAQLESQRKALQREYDLLLKMQLELAQ